MFNDSFLLTLHHDSPRINALFLVTVLCQFFAGMRSIPCTCTPYLLFPVSPLTPAPRRRVLKPPGGGSSNIFGPADDEPAPARANNRGASTLVLGDDPAPSAPPAEPGKADSPRHRRDTGAGGGRDGAHIWPAGDGSAAWGHARGSCSVECIRW